MVSVVPSCFLVFKVMVPPCTKRTNGVKCIVLINQKIKTVVAIEAVFGAEPHEAATVLKDGIDGILGQAVVDG